MTNTAHTPGPWDYRFTESFRDPSQEDCEILGADGLTILRFAGSRHRCAKNVRLIAAAPDLLEAGEDVIATWEKGDLAAAVRKLDAAIAKARGRQ
jgi:hypothetical protein